MQTGRPNGAAQGGARDPRESRLRGGVHPGAEDPRGHVDRDVALLRRLVRQDPGLNGAHQSRPAESKSHDHAQGANRRLWPRHTLELSPHDALVEDGRVPRRR